jgi:hypothetical protein
MIGFLESSPLPLTDNFLLVSDSQGVYQMSLNGSSVYNISVPSGTAAVALDYDPLTSALFWMDSSTMSINRMPIGGGTVLTVVQLTFGRHG